MNLQECFLKLAQIEEDGSQLYQKFSEECSEKIKSVVILFSHEEEKHKELMLELSNNEKLKEKQINEDAEKAFQKQVDYLSNNSKINLASEKEFFGFALQIEKNSIEIYKELLIIFETDSYGYKGLEALIKEERKHMVFILNKLYELV